MSEVGESIVAGFRQMRKFCNQLSLLLKTADGLMGSAGWTPIPRSTVVGNGSGAIDFPYWWLPADFSRFYRHSSQKHLMAFIAAIVNDHPSDPVGVTVSEALLSAGLIKYGLGNDTKVWDYKFCRAHLSRKDRSDGGEMRIFDQPGTIGLPDYVIRISTLARQLSEIQTSEVLNDQIVQPLLDEIKYFSGSVVGTANAVSTEFPA